jgi:hypothetical protein
MVALAEAPATLSTRGQIRRNINMMLHRDQIAIARTLAFSSYTEEHRDVTGTCLGK